MPKVSNIFSGSLDGLTDPVRKDPNQRLADVVERTRASAKQAGSFSPQMRPLQHFRDACFITNVWWRSQGRGIRLFVNPQSMSWRFPLRGTKIKTNAGTLLNMWRNRYKGTYFDEGTVAITFQSGNIMPGAAYDNAELTDWNVAAEAQRNPRPPHGLDNFYDFLELLDTPRLLGSGENYVSLRYYSRVFPEITLHGFFDESGVDWNETATDGNRIQWSSTFNVYWTTPRFQNASAMKAKYREVNSKNSHEVIGKRLSDAMAFREGIPDLPKGQPAGQQRNVGPKTIATAPQNQRVLSSAAGTVAAGQISRRTLDMIGAP